MSNFHKEILIRMNTEVPRIRPQVITNQVLSLLDKLRAFHHFIRYAYDCDLDEKVLQLIQEKLIEENAILDNDLQQFRIYIKKLANRS